MILQNSRMFSCISCMYCMLQELRFLAKYIAQAFHASYVKIYKSTTSIYLKKTKQKLIYEHFKRVTIQKQQLTVLFLKKITVAEHFVTGLNLCKRLYRGYFSLYFFRFIKAATYLKKKIKKRKMLPDTSSHPGNSWKNK